MPTDTSDVSCSDLTITLPDGRQVGYAEYGDPKGIPVLGFHGMPPATIIDFYGE